MYVHRDIIVQLEPGHLSHVLPVPTSTLLVQLTEVNAHYVQLEHISTTQVALHVSHVPRVAPQSKVLLFALVLVKIEHSNQMMDTVFVNLVTNS